MAEKDIVLRIEAVTNQDVIDAYGKEIDSILKTYEDWVKTTKDATAVIEGYNKKIKEGNTLTTEEISELNKAKAKRSEAQRLMRQEDKIRTSVNGSLQQQQLLLSKVNDAIRRQTDEQKKATPELARFQKALYNQVKGVNAELGNFHMNVGNYPQLLQQILPVQSQVGQGLMDMAKGAGFTSGALGALGGALAAGALAYKGFNDAVNLTQIMGDAVAVQVESWTAVYNRFIRMLVEADFTNFISQLRTVKEVTEQTKMSLDELFERENALAIAESKAAIEQQKNLMIMRDQTKTLQERKEAGEAYIASVMELAEMRKSIAQQEYQAQLTNFATQTGLSEDDVIFFIENYNTYREGVNRYKTEQSELQDWIERRRKALRINDTIGYEEATRNIVRLQRTTQESYAAMTEDERRFYDISSKYDLGNDELTLNLVNAWVKVDRAIANAMQSSQRAATTVNSIIAQLNKQGGAGTGATQNGQVEIDTSKVFTFKVDKSQVKIETENLFNALQEEIDAELAGVEPMGGGGTSPLAVMLGVSDDEFKTIKGKALQAAQQIYSSIEKMSQQATQRRLDNELSAIEDKTESEKNIWQSKYDKGVISETEYKRKLEKIDEQAELKREAAQEEAFERQKRWNISNALMNTALAVTNILATNNGGATARAIEVAFALATGAAQTAVIAAQKYARGGELHGASHSQGGIKGNVQGHNIELEGDEVVINKRSARKYRKTLSWINSDNGWGVDFAGVRGGGGYMPQLKYARGGVLGSYDFSPAAVPQSSFMERSIARQAERTEDLIAATNRRIDRLQVQVNISDIEGASDTKQVHINRATLG